MAIKITVKGFDKTTQEIQAAIKAGVQNGLAVAGARGVALVMETIRSPYLGRPPATATADNPIAPLFLNVISRSHPAFVRRRRGRSERVVEVSQREHAERRRHGVAPAAGGARPLDGR